MSRDTLLSPFPWTRYSKKLAQKIDKPRSAGFFTEEDAEKRGMRFASADAGSVEDGNIVRLYWLVDPTDGVIVDSRFQAFGQSALIGAAELACGLLVGKNYDQAQRVSADLVDKQAEDRTGQAAFPAETAPHLNLVIDAIDATAQQCDGIPLPATYSAPPVNLEIGEVLENGIPGWKDFGIKEKIAIINEVLDKEVRPYIELDGGGIEVLNLLNEREVIIAYQGACTSCFAATGATLNYIQQVLKARVFPELVVVPNL